MSIVSDLVDACTASKNASDRLITKTDELLAATENISDEDQQAIIAATAQQLAQAEACNAEADKVQNRLDN